MKEFIPELMSGYTSGRRETDYAPDGGFNNHANNGLGTNIAKKIMRDNPDIADAVGSLREYDQDTFEHSFRSGNNASLVAREMGLDEKESELLISSAIVHDIGKIYLDPLLLNKSGILSPEERKKISEHVTMGYERILKYSPEIAEIVNAHHPNPDKPLHFLDPKIEKLARVIIVIDVFDALTHERSYKKEMSLAETEELLEKQFTHPIEKQAIEILIRSASSRDNIQSA